LRGCRETVAQKWDASREKVEQVWKIYQGNGIN